MFSLLHPFLLLLSPLSVPSSVARWTLCGQFVSLSLQKIVQMVFLGVFSGLMFSQTSDVNGSRSSRGQCKGCPLLAVTLSNRTPDGSSHRGRLKKHPLLPRKVLYPGESMKIIAFTANMENTSLSTTSKEDGVNWRAKVFSRYSLAPVCYYFSQLSGTPKQSKHVYSCL